MKYFENEHAIINYNEDNKLIDVKWKLRDADSGNYRLVMSKALVLSKWHESKVWLSDLSDVHTMPEEDKKWLQDTLLPHIPKDIEKIAFFFNKDTYSQEQAQEFVDIAKSKGLNVRHFYTRKDACEWIGRNIE